jgi:hypothetical protein
VHTCNPSTWENEHELKVSLEYIVRLCLSKKEYPSPQIKTPNLQKTKLDNFPKQNLSLENMCTFLIAKS